MWTATNDLAERRQRFRFLRHFLRAGNHFQTADRIAVQVGYPNRFAMNRHLKACGLPTYRRLMQLSRLAAVHRRARRVGTTMSRAARPMGLSPAWVSRTLRHCCDLDWTRAQAVSTSELVRRTLHRSARSPS